MSGNDFRVPLVRPEVGDEELKALAGVLQSRWLTQGPAVAEFERVFAQYVGVRHAVAVSSGTAALHVTLAALGIGPGDEVIVPAFTFVATANAVLYQGARPVFVDIDLETFNLNVEAVIRAFTPKTRAIIAVHLFGLSADVEPLLEVARQQGIHVVEDAACALGTRYKGRHVGSLGTAGCFSFHPRKVLTTGEGGMITTDDDDLARRMRAIRSHGVEPGRQLVGQEDAYQHLGYNYRISDIAAAIGIEQMRKLDTILYRRQAIALRYDRALNHISGAITPAVPCWSNHTYQAYVVLLHLKYRERDQLIHDLNARGVETRPGTQAIHLLAYYRNRFGFRPNEYPNAVHAYERSLALPMYPSLKDYEQEYVIDNLKYLLQGGSTKTE